MKARKISSLKKFSEYPFMRDVMVTEIGLQIKKNKEIFFLNADMGAPALDSVIKKYPNNIVHCGISEQNMITVASGMALRGCKVFCYGMAPFVTSRCYEQLKISLSAMNVPVCVVGIGPGLGYADAGPTHYATEDLGIIAALPNFNILTASDHISCKILTKKILNTKKLTYFRIDRDSFPNVYYRKDINYFDTSFKKGFNEIVRGKETCIISSGYLIHKIIENSNHLLRKKNFLGIIDLYQHNPLNTKELNKVLKRYKKIIIIDEQVEKLGTKSILFNEIDFSLLCKIKNFSLPNKFIFENGGRDHLLIENGINIKEIIKSI